MENTINKLKVIYGDATLGVKCGAIHCIFSYDKGGLVSLKKAGKEWLYRTPRPAFWRATTDNDRGSMFPYKSAMWMGADQFVKLASVAVSVDGEEIPLPIAPENNKYSNDEFCDSIAISYVFTTPTVPSTTVKIEYTVNTTTGLRVQMNYDGQKSLPELPVLGLRFIMPTKASIFTYEGLSGETYPDRMSGGIQGLYKVEGLPVTPYLVPQDCGVHMDTKWVEVTRTTTLNNQDKDEDKFSLRFEKDEANFAFSALPYTSLELESATHQEELPLPRRTVLTILGAVRGVGGIDSWWSDVEAPYRLSGEEDYQFSFFIR